MSDENNELLEIFWEEVATHLATLNGGMLEVEMTTGEKRQNTLEEMNRAAHTLKGAARAVGKGMIETIGHYMEEIYQAAMQDGFVITPDVADTLYDSLDLMQNMLQEKPNPEQVVADVLANLENIVTQNAAQRRASTTIQDKTETDTFDAPIDETVITPHITLPNNPPFPNAEEIDTGQIQLMDLFQIESEEYITTLHGGLLRIESLQGTEHQALLIELNRVAHSLKGAARAVGISLVVTVSHYLEEYFHIAIENNDRVTPELADTLYKGVDLIQDVLSGIQPDERVIEGVLRELQDISEPHVHTDDESKEIPMLRVPENTQATTQEAPIESLAQFIKDTAEVTKPTHDTREVVIEPARNITGNPTDTAPTLLIRPIEETIRVAVNKLDRLMAEASELIVAKMQGEARQQHLRNMQRNLARWQREWRSVRGAYIRLVRRMQDSPEELPIELTTIFKFLEVNQRYLYNITREISSLTQISAQDNLQLATVADQLQDDVQDLRLMPFETIIGGFQRMVRDQARDTNKQVQFQMNGVGIEIDKTVLDALKEPLMHLLRNAVDHGIEPPETRLRIGKDPIGRLDLDVEQRGAEIVIRVRDDGRGIDITKIKQRAVERGIITQAEATTLSDDDARLLVFQSGFSTSDTVTDISGRGLGMDIVRDRVESLRGRVSLQSTVRMGTTTTIIVPVSLTRIRAIILQVGDEQYAIPAFMVSRMESIPRDSIYTANGQEMVNINDQPMILASMANILNISAIDDDNTPQISVVALQTADRTIAFAVDSLSSEIELVLKPLGPELANAPFVSGAALLGSGDIMLILDANDLVRSASGASLPTRRRAALQRPQPAVPRRVRVLVVDDSITTRTLEKNILEAVGFDVQVAIDGEEAWEMVSEVEPDIIVSDVEMPHMNGLELTRKLKSTTYTQDIPVILLTSLGKPEQREAGMNAGADAYLVKSQFDQAQLLKTIQTLLV